MGNSFLLRNYASFLHDVWISIINIFLLLFGEFYRCILGVNNYWVQGNLSTEEEYYERAILSNPDDGEVLDLYAKLMCEVHKHACHAEAYLKLSRRILMTNDKVLFLAWPLLWKIYILISFGELLGLIIWNWIIWVTNLGFLFGIFVLSSYSHFIWDSEEGEEENTDSESNIGQLAW